jgi:hypothetical protein
MIVKSKEQTHKQLPTRRAEEKNKEETLRLQAKQKRAKHNGTKQSRWN